MLGLFLWNRLTAGEETEVPVLRQQMALLFKTMKIKEKLFCWNRLIEW